MNLTAVRPLVQRLGVATDRLVPPPAGITVLIYHRVGGGSDSAVDLPAEQFEAQVAHLAAHHRILTLDQAIAELTAGSPSGWGAANAAASDSDAPADAGADTDDRRGVVLTCDDGTSDFVDVLVPILERHQVPITLYAATHFIHTGERFPWDAPPASWAGLADTLTTGLVTIGSHTHTHRLLDKLDGDALAEDLDRSIDLIGDRLGVRADHFAYPKAVPGSPAAEIAVRRRFRSASLAASRVNRPDRTDPHRLWRTPLQRSDSAELFACKADGGLRLEGELRALVARARYRRDDR